MRTKYYAVRNAGQQPRPGSRRGVSVDAIQQRYYRMRRSRLQPEAPAGRRAATPTAAPTAAAATESPAGIELGGAGDLSSLSMLELASIARQVNVELERRVTRLQQSGGAS